MEKPFLEKRILATLIWHNILDFPLTSFEIWQYLIKEKKNQKNTPISLKEVVKTLEESIFLKNHVSEKNGFYFLKGQGDLVKKRIFQNKLSVKKWKRFRRIIKAISFIPYIRMVGVTGSMSFSNPRKESDLDVFIITAKNRIWLCRFLVTALTQILGVRRHEEKTRNKICLNHYISEEKLEVSGKSLYVAYEYLKMVPVFSRNAYDKFIQENKWIEGFLATAKTSYSMNKRLLKNRKQGYIIKNFFEILLNNFGGDFLEKALGGLQEKRIKKSPLYKKPGGRVVSSEIELEFHPDSPQKRILEKFNKEAANLGLNEFIPQKDSGLIKQTKS